SNRQGALCGVLAMTLMVIMALPAVAAPCESLSSLKLPDATITSAQSVAAGEFSPDGERKPFKSLPAFCRVTAEIKPSKDSDIKIEVWMPLAGWNGKYQALGNGGFAGMIGYPGMAGAVSRGYAAASTDTGHAGAGTDSSWGL